MSVEKAGSEGVTPAKKSGLTLYYYLNAREESAAFQSIHNHFQQCFSSTIWELGGEEKLKACLEDTMPELCRHPKNEYFCLCLETKRFATWFQMHYIVLFTYLAYEYSCLREECLKLKWEYSAYSLGAEIPRELQWVTWKGRELIHVGAAEDCSAGTQGADSGSLGRGRGKGCNLPAWQPSRKHGRERPVRVQLFIPAQDTPPRLPLKSCTCLAGTQDQLHRAPVLSKHKTQQAAGTA